MITDLSKRLREVSASFATKLLQSDILAAADEIERYHGGMLAWKRSAEAMGAVSLTDELDVARDAARWRFMMRVVDNENGPEAMAANSLGGEEMEKDRLASTQMCELADQAIEIVTAQEKAQ